MPSVRASPRWCHRHRRGHRDDGQLVGHLDSHTGRKVDHRGIHRNWGRRRLHRRLLAAVELSVPLDLGVTLSSATGFSLAAATGLAVNVPVSSDFSPVRLGKRYFVEDLDQAMAGEQAPGQRLRSRLSEFFGDVRPIERTENPTPPMEWLAKDPVTLHARPLVAEVLMRSEVALTRCRKRYAIADVESDVGVEDAIDDLLRLASGPYGGSNVAHQRCAELGLLAPDLFFVALRRHFDSSPVGFRLLRCFDRFVNLWRRQQEGATTPRPGVTRTTRDIGALMRSLGSASTRSPWLDAYPGGEWACTLAVDCLRTGRELALARNWLEAKYENIWPSDRERAYAAWASVLYGEDDASVAKACDALRSSKAPMLQRWGELFIDAATLRRLDEREVLDRVREKFGGVADLVSQAVDAHVTDESLDGVRDALESVVFAALVTPDGRLRRNLIEAVVASCLVAPTTKVLLDVYRANPMPGVRESAIFFLSRLRQPDDEVVDELIVALEDDVPSVRHAATWGLGDVFGVGSLQDSSRLVEPLRRAALGESTDYVYQRVAAAHALAVIGLGAHDDDTIDEVLPQVRSGLGRSALECYLAGLIEWGIRMRRREGIVDPTALGVTGFLG